MNCRPLIGMTPSGFRRKASRARAKGDDWRLHRDQWPDQRTPLYDPDKINALKEKS